VILEGRLVATVHVETIEGFDEFVDDAYFVTTVRFVHAGFTEESVEQAGLLQTDVLDGLVVVLFGFEAAAGLRTPSKAHIDNL